MWEVYGDVVYKDLKNGIPLYSELKTKKVTDRVGVDSIKMRSISNRIWTLTITNLGEIITTPSSSDEYDYAWFDPFDNYMKWGTYNNITILNSRAFFNTASSISNPLIFPQLNLINGITLKFKVKLEASENIVVYNEKLGNSLFEIEVGTNSKGKYTLGILNQNRYYELSRITTNLNASNFVTITAAIKPERIVATISDGTLAETVTSNALENMAASDINNVSIRCIAGNQIVFDNIGYYIG